MKRLNNLCLISLLFASAAQANAAFLVEAHGSGKANASNFAIIPGAGNATGASTSGASDAVGTTATNSIFASNNTVAGVVDTYQFSYTPGTDADNTVFAAGTVLGSKGGFPGDGSRATGLTGGSTELYNVYFTTTASSNVNPAGSNFTITQDGAPIVLPLLNLNNTGTGPDTNPGAGAGANFVGGANHAWKLLGTVHLTAGTTYTVTQTSNVDSFVSQRAHGVMWELTPEPSLGIYNWEYIDPNDPSLGKRQSTTPAPDGAGVNAVPFANLSGRNLTMAYLDHVDLHNAILSNSNLSVAELSHSNLTNANLRRANFSQANLTFGNLSGADLTGSNLSDAILADAIVKNAKLSSTHITLDQLYSTASYKDHDLTGVHFVGNDLSGADFTDQGLASASFYAAKLVGADLTNADLTNADLVNADLSGANLTGANFTNATLVNANLGQAILTDANFNGANLTGTNLTGADLRGAQLGGVTTYVYGYICGKPSVGGCLYYTYGVVSTEIGGGVNLAQLITTANYQTHDLSDIDLSRTNLAGANFAGFNLTNADFTNATLTEADLSGADARGASGLEGVAAPNLIRPDGHLAGLTLGGGQSLDVRDYDGGTSGTIPITVDEQLTMAAGATLRMVFDADAWDSTISFAPGIPVMLEGNLELALADGVDPFSQIGRTFHVFDWTGVTPTGSFAIATPYDWDLTNLYTTGQINFLAASGSGGNAQSSRAIPEPNTFFLLAVGLVAAWLKRRIHTTRTFAAPCVSAGKMWLIVMLLLVPGQHSFANPPSIQLTKIANPVWKPVDFQLFSAPAIPFDQEFGQVYNTLLPYDTPLAEAYVPHAPPYDTELSASMITGGYVSRSLFTPDAITLQPNGVYFAYLMAPDPGTTGSSRDFTSGPIIPNSIFPIATNVDVWLDGVLVDKTPGADALIPVQPRDAVFEGTSHLEYLFAIWHPWDDDLTVGPLGNYDLRLSIRDVGGSGWDVVVPFRVSVPGDYDYSGTVGPEDYAVWKANFGSTTNLDSDGNDNHIVDAADYTIWRDHLGLTVGTGSGAALSSAGSQSSAVPEPGALFLFACGLAALFATRRAPADLWHVARICKATLSNRSSSGH